MEELEPLATLAVPQRFLKIGLQMTEQFCSKVCTQGK